MSFRTLSLCFALLAMVSMVGAQVHSAEGDDMEYTLKAGFLFNFLKFVEWPAQAFDDPEAPIVVCLLGQDPFGDILDSMAGRAVRGRKIDIKRCSELKEMQPCHVVFVSESETRKLSGILSALDERPILTVSDLSGFASRGG